MNIAELLQKYAQKDEVFYSPCFGEVLFIEFDSTYIKISTKERDQIRDFFVDGRYDINGECMLFPSKDQRDWQKWKEIKEIQWDFKYKVGDRVLFTNSELGVVTEANPNTFTVLFVKDDDFVEYEQKENNNLKKIDHFDYNLLKIFDPVLVRDGDEESWCISHFSHIDANVIYCENRCPWHQCIPFNSETKKLHNTANKAPEFYNVKIG